MLIVCNVNTGEWEHFLYVGKIALFGWLLHFGTCSFSLSPSFPPIAFLPMLVVKLTWSHTPHSSVLNHGSRNLHPPLCTSLPPSTAFFFLSNSRYLSLSPSHTYHLIPSFSFLQRDLELAPDALFCRPHGRPHA